MEVWTAVTTEYRVVACNSHKGRYVRGAEAEPPAEGVKGSGAGDSATPPNIFHATLPIKPAANKRAADTAIQKRLVPPAFLNGDKDDEAYPLEVDPEEPMRGAPSSSCLPFVPYPYEEDAMLLTER